MRKMAVVISSHTAAPADKVMKKAKESLGLTKGARVLEHNGLKAVFVSGLAQKNTETVDFFDKYKDYHMLIFSSLPEAVAAKPGLYDIKIHVNNNLGFSFYICSVPMNYKEINMDTLVDDLCDVIKNNMGIA